MSKPPPKPAKPGEGRTERPCPSSPGTARRSPLTRECLGFRVCAQLEPGRGWERGTAVLPFRTAPCRHEPPRRSLGVGGEGCPLPPLESTGGCPRYRVRPGRRSRSGEGWSVPLKSEPSPGDRFPVSRAWQCSLAPEFLVCGAEPRRPAMALGVVACPAGISRPGAACLA